MTNQNEAGSAPGLASNFKRAIRLLLLWAFASPAVIAGVFLLLPYILPDDPELHLAGEAHDRSLMILVGSLVVTYIVHRATKSWARVNAVPDARKREDQNGH